MVLGKQNRPEVLLSPVKFGLLGDVCPPSFFIHYPRAEPLYFRSFILTDVQKGRGPLMQTSKRIVAEHVLQLFVAATVVLTLAFLLLGSYGAGAVS